MANPLTNLSYTNKDFNSIYVELLDLVKKLTYKWDPSISNESDPGVILLKLNAIIGDKNNYNIDKNILEDFPETLTQDISARSLYKQLAYRMPWYRAATTDLSMVWKGKDKYELTDGSLPVIIPKFQMVTDSNNEFVYTTLQEVIFTKDALIKTVPSIEGTINTLTINGETIVQLNNLDYQNRVYFDDYNVAENGIFIYNENGSNNDYWTMVDNLQVEALGNKFFEFGIDSRKNLCYVEFPEDIHELIGTGLIIRYISTNGLEGNIISKTINKFYEEVKTEVNGEPTVLSADLLEVTNPNGTNNGANPEDLDDAYKHYRKTAGTFHTLVTLRDYINAIYSSGYVSNVKVADRLHDVQSSYTIVTDDGQVSGDILQIAETKKSDYIGYTKASSVYKYFSEVPLDVKYFEYNTDLDHPGQMIEVELLQEIQDEIQVVNNNSITILNKPISSVISITKENDAPLDSSISWRISDKDEGIILFSIDPADPVEMPDTVKISYYSGKDWEKYYFISDDVKQDLNAFDLRLYILHNPGEVITYDNYISTFNLEPSGGEVENKVIGYIDNERCIQHDFEKILPDIPCLFKNLFQLGIKIIPHYFLDVNQINNLKVNINRALFKLLNSNKLEYGVEPNYDVIYDTILNADDRIKVLILDDFIFTTLASYWDAEKETFKDIPISTFNSSRIITITEEDINIQGEVTESNILSYISGTLQGIINNNDIYKTSYFIYTSSGNYNNYVYKINANGAPELYSKNINQFRLDIITKSILAGRTPLHNEDSLFTYTLDQEKRYLATNDTVTTYLEITPQNKKDEEVKEVSRDNYSYARFSNYQLKDNENLRLLAPSFSTKETYSNYVKYELILNDSHAVEREEVLRYDDWFDDKEKYQQTKITKIVESALEGHSVERVTRYAIPQDYFTGSLINDDTNAEEYLFRKDIKRFIFNNTTQTYVEADSPDSNTSFGDYLLNQDYLHYGDVNSYYKGHYSWNVFEDYAIQARDLYPSDEEYADFSLQDCHVEYPDIYFEIDGFINTVTGLEIDGTPWPVNICEVRGNRVYLSGMAPDPDTKPSDFPDDRVVISYFQYYIGEVSLPNYDTFCWVSANYILQPIGKSQPAKWTSEWNSKYFTTDPVTGVYIQNTISDWHNALNQRGGLYYRAELNWDGFIDAESTDGSETPIDHRWDPHYTTNFGDDFDTIYLCFTDNTTNKVGRVQYISTYTEKFRIQWAQSDDNFNYTIDGYDIPSACGFYNIIPTTKLTSYLYCTDLTEDELFAWRTSSTTSYSAYIEISYLNTVYILEGNTDYKLSDAGQGEWLVFFYKTEDDDESPYQYKKYGPGTIIQSSFTVQGSGLNNQIVPVNRLAEKGSIIYSELGSSYYQKIYNMGSYNDLSGSKSISIRGINEVEIHTNDNQYYYFITNKTQNYSDNDIRYIMQPDENGNYILENDEYFIHVPKYKNSFEILGAGTLLKFYNYDNDSETRIPYVNLLTVQKVDYTKINSEGLKSFLDYCKKINEFNVTIREQQIYNFSNTDSVIFTVREDIGRKLGVNSQEEYPEYAYIDALDIRTGKYLDRIGTWVYESIEDASSSTQPSDWNDIYNKDYYTISGKDNNGTWEYDNYIKILKGTPQPGDWNTNYNTHYWIYYWNSEEQKYEYRNNTQSDWATALNQSNGLYTVRYILNSISDFNKAKSQSGGLFRKSTQNQSYTKIVQGKPISLSSSYDISYQVGGEGPVTDLPKIHIDVEDVSWKITANLSIQCSYDTAQKINVNNYNCYKFIYTDNSEGKLSLEEVLESIKHNENIPCLYIPGTVEDKEELYLMSNIPLDTFGGEDISVGYIDVNGVSHSTALYIYSLSSSFIDGYNNGYLFKDNDDNISIALKDISGTQQTVQQNLDSNHKLILPIINDNEHIGISVLDNLGNNIKPINVRYDNEEEYYYNGTYYFMLDYQENNNDIAKYTINWVGDIEKGDEIILKPLQRIVLGKNDPDLFVVNDNPNYYVYNIHYSGEDGIYERLLDYDIKQKFNYTYVPDEERYIEDPLESTSFFNAMHIFNDYTLPMADLYMSSKLDSNIVLINNK